MLKNFTFVTFDERIHKSSCYGPSQTTMMDLFTRIVSSFKLMFVTIFAKSFIADV